jgi:hypothetical protein
MIPHIKEDCKTILGFKVTADIVAEKVFNKNGRVSIKMSVFYFMQ